jgi:hypothetical protein
LRNYPWSSYRFYVETNQKAGMADHRTPEKTNRGLRIGKGRSFGHIASLTILRSLIAAGFVVALADPLAVRAASVEAGLSP